MWSTLCRRTAADGGKPQFSPLFPHEKAAFLFCGKLRTSFFQSGEGPNRQSERTVKRKENPSTFFYIKGKVPTFLPRNWHESPGCITACISKTRFPCGKPGGKSGKPHGKLALFFTKTVENPVEKVKSSFQTGKSIHFPVVLLCRKIRLTAVFLGGRCGGFPHCGIALNAPANHGTITAEKCGKTHRYRNTMRWRHPI